MELAGNLGVRLTRLPSSVFRAQIVVSPHAPDAVQIAVGMIGPMSTVGWGAGSGVAEPIPQASAARKRAIAAHRMRQGEHVFFIVYSPCSCKGRKTNGVRTIVRLSALAWRLQAK